MAYLRTMAKLSVGHGKRPPSVLARVLAAAREITPTTTASGRNRRRTRVAADHAQGQVDEGAAQDGRAASAN